jgi:hypothetical protein
MPARQKGSRVNPLVLGILIDYQARQGHGEKVCPGRRRNIRVMNLKSQYF